MSFWRHRMTYLVAAVLVTAAVVITTAIAHGWGRHDDDAAGTAQAVRTHVEPTSFAPRGRLDTRGHEVYVGRVPALSRAEHDVVSVWFDYWRLRGRAFHDVRIDRRELDKVASGEAADEVVSYVRYLRLGREHAQGDARLSINRVEVRGNNARLTGCLQNRSRNIDREGRPAEMIIPRFTVSGEFQRTLSGWRVANFTATPGACRRG